MTFALRGEGKTGVDFAGQGSCGSLLFQRLGQRWVYTINERPERVRYGVTRSVVPTQTVFDRLANVRKMSIHQRTISI